MESSIFIVNVIIEKNSPPYFVGWPEDPIQYTEGSGTHLFVLPEIIDEQGDQFSISVNLGDAESFSFWDSALKSFIFNMDQVTGPQKFTIKIGLKDEYSMVTKYRLQLEVLEKVVEANNPPYFTEWASYSIV